MYLTLPTYSPMDNAHWVMVFFESKADQDNFLHSTGLDKQREVKTYPLDHGGFFYNLKLFKLQLIMPRRFLLASERVCVEDYPLRENKNLTLFLMGNELVEEDPRDELIFHMEE
jgi:hypothetical protein